MRRWREPPHALPLAALAAAVTLVLIAAGGRGATRPGDASASSWKGLAGEQRPHVAVGQRMIVLLKAPSLADRQDRSARRDARHTSGSAGADDQTRHFSA